MLSEHWDVISTVITRWWPPLHERDRVPEADLIAAEQRLDLRLPQALRHWYLRAGRRLDFMGNADHFLPPERLYICDNLLCIGSENQGCFRWWIPLRYCYLNDPPVTIDEALPQESLFLQNNAYRVPKHDEVAHRRSFTEFIRDMIIRATILHGQFKAWGDVSASTLRRIAQAYEPFVQSSYSTIHRLWDEDTLIQWHPTTPAGDGYLRMTARTHTVFRRFLTLIEPDWNGGYYHGAADRWGHFYTPECQEAPMPIIINRRTPAWFRIEESPLSICHQRALQE